MPAAEPNPPSPAIRSWSPKAITRSASILLALALQTIPSLLRHAVGP
jgi:hypothetical protein